MSPRSSGAFRTEVLTGEVGVVRCERLDLSQHLDDPEQLERLYRAAPRDFERALSELDAAHVLVRAWRARLAPAETAAAVARAVSWQRVVWIAIGTALIARLVHFEGEDAGVHRLARYAGFICLVPISGVLWRRRALQRSDVALAVCVLAACVMASILPLQQSQSGLLGLAHLPPMLIAVMFTVVAPGLVAQRAEFVALAVEIVIYTLALLFGGVLLTGLTIGVFTLIKLDISKFYFNNIVVAGAAAAPVVAAGLERARADRGERLGPTLARIFSPLALVTLLAYAIAIIGTRNNPYQDRDSLAVLYAMLLATALLVTLMLLQAGERTAGRGLLLLACAIACLSIAVDAIALSAIIYRFASYGMSPNRLAVLGGNLLLFGYLCGLTVTLARAAKSRELQRPLWWIAQSIPYFGVWSALWVFVFPWLFHFR